LNIDLIQKFGVVISLLTTGEALALIIGLLVFKKPALKWAKGVNILLVLSDLIFGGYLVQIYLGLISDRNKLETVLIIMVLIATHSFRASQTLRLVRNPYCFNRPLGIVNWIKLAGLLVLFFTAAHTY
jgi:hypothetical protein